jgi:hypothetical protein
MQYGQQKKSKGEAMENKTYENVQRSFNHSNGDDEKFYRISN